MATKRTTTKKTTATSSKRTVKKTTPKTKVSEPVETSYSSASASTSNAAPKQNVKVRKSYVALIIVILLLGAGLYYFRGLFVAAVVNGQPISRFDVIKQTEKESGKQTLDTLVRNALIEQKAKEQNVTVSEKETNDEIKKLQDNFSKQGQNLDQVLTTQGMNRDDLKKLLSLDILVKKMVSKDIKVSDAEVNDYIEKNKDALPQGTDEATLKKQVTEQLTQQKKNEKIRTWLADLQKQAKVVYFVQY